MTLGQTDRWHFMKKITLHLCFQLMPNIKLLKIINLKSNFQFFFFLAQKLNYFGFQHFSQHKVSQKKCTKVQRKCKNAGSIWTIFLHKTFFRKRRKEKKRERRKEKKRNEKELISDLAAKVFRTFFKLNARAQSKKTCTGVHTWAKLFSIFLFVFFFFFFFFFFSVSVSLSLSLSLSFLLEHWKEKFKMRLQIKKVINNKGHLKYLWFGLTFCFVKRFGSKQSKDFKMSRIKFNNQDAFK